MDGGMVVATAPQGSRQTAVEASTGFVDGGLSTADFVFLSGAIRELPWSWRLEPETLDKPDSWHRDPRSAERFAMIWPQDSGVVKAPNWLPWWTIERNDDGYLIYGATILNETDEVFDLVRGCTSLHDAFQHIHGWISDNLDRWGLALVKPKPRRATKRRTTTGQASQEAA